MAAKRKTVKGATKPSATRKTRAPSRTSEKADLEVQRNVKTENKPPVIFTNKRLYLLAAILAIGGLLYLARGLFVAALVNGYPITRVAVIRDLERQGGSEALDNLVTKRLIAEEAESRRLTVTDDEVNAKIDELKKTLEAQGQTLESALEMQGQDMTILRESIHFTKLIEKMFEADTKVSDEEIQGYYDNNKESYGEQTLEAVRSQIEDQLKQQKLFEAYRNWLAEKKANSKINYFVNY